MSQKKQIVFSLVGLSILAVGARADEQPDAMQILRAADQAARAVKAVEYEAEFHATGELAERLPSVSGTVVLKKPAPSFLGLSFGQPVSPTRVRGVAFVGGPRGKVEFDIGIMGKNVFAFDVQRQTCLRAQLAKPRLPYAPAVRLLMPEFTVDSPFGDEMRGRVIEYRRVEDVAGLSCDALYVEYANGSKSRWWFGREDKLPRRVERITDNGSLFLYVKNLDTEPDVGDAVFGPACPDGFLAREWVLIGEAAQIPKEYAGVYRISESATREVSVEGNRLFTRRSGNARLPLFPASDTEFYYADSLVSLTFFRDEDGKVTHHVLDRLFGDREKAVKIDDVPNAPIAK